MNCTTNRAALYCRLSKEDVDKINKGDDSESIINQRRLLEDYALNNGFSIYQVYQDDDYSGLFDDRPGFEKMIQDARAGKFDIIVAKTQSRFTRNMEHTEHYLHDVFPFLGIRFIGVVDNVDTFNKGNKKTRQINGLVNEWYCEDLSENVKAVFKSKMRQGQYLGSSAPYGYVKSQEDNHKLVIDEYAAGVVKEIFSLYLNGYSKYRISQILNDKHILNPSKYKSEVLKTTYYNPRNSSSSLWTAQSIDMILKNEVYIGAVVQNKQASISYKNRKKIKVPESEQIKVYNMHEPVISLDMWNLTQQALKLRTRETGIKKRVDLFSDKLYCADCGKRLTRKYNKKHEFVGYHCSTYKKFGNNGCTMHNCNYEDLKHIVLDTIQNTAREILTYDDVESLKVLTKDDESKLYQSQLNQLEQKSSSYQRYIEKIYRDYLDEIITRDEYIKYRNDYTNELNETLSKIEQLKSKILQNDDTKNDEDVWFKNFRNYINIDELDRVIILELIDKIEILESGEIRIAFRFKR